MKRKITALEKIAKLTRKMRVIRVPDKLWDQGWDELGKVEVFDYVSGTWVIVNQRFCSPLIDEPHYLVRGVAICVEDKK